MSQMGRRPSTGHSAVPWECQNLSDLFIVRGESEPPRVPFTAPRLILEAPVFRRSLAGSRGRK